MLWCDRTGRVLPLSVGRAGRFGRMNGEMSASLRDTRRNLGKFARWGSNYAYHLGDVSAVSCVGHDASRATPKYRRWADRLFMDAPSDSPTLRRPVYFWATPWGQ